MPMISDTARERTLTGGFTPSEAIVLMIAAQTGEDPGELPRLYDVVDPEALDRVVQRQGSCRVTFEYTGYEVTVSGPDQITIHDLESDRPGERT